MHILLKGERLHVDSQHEDDEYINGERDLLPITNDDDMLQNCVLLNAPILSHICEWSRDVESVTLTIQQR